MLQTHQSKGPNEKKKKKKLVSTQYPQCESTTDSSRTMNDVPDEGSSRRILLRPLQNSEVLFLVREGHGSLGRRRVKKSVVGTPQLQKTDELPFLLGSLPSMDGFKCVVPKFRPSGPGLGAPDNFEYLSRSSTRVPSRVVRGH